MKPLELAITDLGYTESPKNSNKTKYGKWYGLDGQPWCMMAVQYWFDKTGFTLPARTASCSALLNWYKKYAPKRIIQNPEPNDIVIYNFGHTGIVESNNGTTITAIEGNTSSTDAGSQDNGGGVYRKVRNKNVVTAFIRPFDNINQEEEEEELTQEQFNEMFKKAMESYQASLRDNEAGDWSLADRTWAIQKGIVRGNGETTNGEPNYMWESPVTREQMATMLRRALKE